ncbi:MAG: tetratricopeptide repeat protein [Desulfobacterales bacterium]|nr:tetratricopeptide repeat protein [Desulfobacterales bacterium]
MNMITKFDRESLNSKSDSLFLYNAGYTNHEEDKGKNLFEAKNDILAGTNFLNYIKERFGVSQKFTVLAIKIDNCNANDCANEYDVSDFFNAIDKEVKKEKGIWGIVDTCVLGILFLDIDSSYSIKIADKIRKSVFEVSKETISIGIADYPMLDFTRSETLENASKSLDHASFHGPSSTIIFNAVTLNISADKLYQSKYYEDAVRELKRAIILDPLNINAHNSLGVCYGVMGMFDEAIKEFESVIRINENELMAIYNIGYINMLKGLNEKALEFFLNAKKINKDVFEIEFQLGRLYYEMNKMELAKKCFEKSAELKPESPFAYRYIGDVALKLNAIPEAIKAYKKAVKIATEDAASFSGLGYAMFLNGENFEICAVFCKKSVAIDYNNSIFRHRLGIILFKQKKFEEALQEFKIAEALGYDSSEFIKEIQQILIYSF